MYKSNTSIVVNNCYNCNKMNYGKNQVLNNSECVLYIKYAKMLIISLLDI